MTESSLQEDEGEEGDANKPCRRVGSDPAADKLRHAAAQEVRAAVDAAKSSSDAKKKANAKANAKANTKAKKPKRAAAEDDAAAEDAAKAPPIEKPEEEKADEALKAPVAEGDLESYEAQMMGPGNAQ